MAGYDNNFWKWVEDHRDNDPMRLRLGKKPTDPAWIDDAIAQIENERRARLKFGNTDTHELTPRLMPIGLSVEQATSARIAMLHYDISGLNADKPARVLDMTCGLGIDASFLARNTNTRLTAIDLNEKIAEVAAYNFATRPNIEVLNCDSIRYLEQSDEHFDIIFIDPARRDDSGGRVYNLHDCSPDVTRLLPLMLEKSTRVMIKMSPMLDVSQTLRDLPGTKDLYVVDERGECRELLAVIDSTSCDTTVITAWSDGRKFSFRPGDEASASTTTAMPAKGQILLEPSPALMKAAPFKLICERYDSSMIHPNTHLYTSATLPTGFPGKAYKIDEVLPYASANIKRIVRSKLNADVAVRNFPISADALRSRLGIKKSGETRIAGITACDGNQYLLFLSATA